MFSRTSSVVRILFHPRRTIGISGWFERFMRADLRFVLRCAFFHIGLHVKLAAWSQQTRDLVEQIRVHDETFGVFLLPPRIWKVQEKRFDRGIRTQTPESFACIAIEHSSASSQALLAQTFVDDGRPLHPNFQTEEPTVWSGSGSFEKKSTSPWTDLDFDGTFSGHERSDIDVTFAGKTGGISVGMVGSRLKHHGGAKQAHCRDFG
jgi:hypothetical protein